MSQSKVFIYSFFSSGYFVESRQIERIFDRCWFTSRTISLNYKNINSNMTHRTLLRLPTCPHVSIPHTIFQKLPCSLRKGTGRANRVEMCWLVLVKVWCMALSESTAIWKSLQWSLLFSNQSELYILKENVQLFNIWI